MKTRSSRYTPKYPKPTVVSFIRDPLGALAFFFRCRLTQSNYGIIVAPP